MRIAVSGTHSVGKSTLVWDFTVAHPGFIREEEPYRVLRDNYPIKFGKDSTRYCNGLQLYYNISRVQRYLSPADHVVFDRSPVDYIAYSLYTAHYHQTDLDAAFVDSLIQPVRDALTSLDLLVYVPISAHHPMHLEDDGIRLTDKEYRTEVDHYFRQMYREGLYDLFKIKNRPRLVEVTGSREERLAQLRAFVQ